MSMMGLGLSLTNMCYDRLAPIDTSEQCWEFDGSDEYISKAAHDSVFNHSSGGNSKFSISFWIKTSTTSYDCLVARNSYGKGSGASLKKDWAINLVGFTNIIVVDIYDTVARANLSNVTDTVTLTDGNWHHLVVTYDGEESTAADRLTVYINGVEQNKANHHASNPAAIDAEEPGFVIGAYYADNATLPYEGKTDEVFYVNRYVLSQAQVTWLYSNGITHDLSLFLPAETRAYYKMGDGDGTGSNNVLDSAGTNHLTTTNMESGDIKNDAP